MQTLAPSRTIRSLAVDIGLAIATGLLAALAKRYLDFSLGIPGHAGVGWIAVLVAGRLLNGRPGMATLAGVSMAVWGVPVGLNHSLAYNGVLYGLSGALLDSGPLLRLPLRRPWGAMTAGAIVHVAKFGYVFFNAWWATSIRRVEIFGFTRALTNHVLFGLAGGLLGWAIWRTRTRMRINRGERRRASGENLGG